MNDTATAVEHVRRLQLEFDPFATSQRGKLLYDGAERQARLEEAVHFLHFGTGAVLLTGAHGAGKTTLLHRILGQCGGFAERCWVEADEWSAEALPALIGEQLGYAAVQCATWQGLSALVQQAPAEEVAIVAIDDADRLSDDVLAALWRLYQESDQRLRLLLTATTDLRARLQPLPDAEHQVRLLELRPLTATELGELASMQLRAAGYRGAQPLSMLQQEELAVQSRGAIGAALDLLPRLLAEPEPSRLASLPWPHFGAMALVLVLLGVSYWYQGRPEAARTQVVQPIWPAAGDAAKDASPASRATAAALPDLRAERDNTPDTTRSVDAGAGAAPRVETALAPQPDTPSGARADSQRETGPKAGSGPAPEPKPESALQSNTAAGPVAEARPEKKPEEKPPQKPQRKPGDSPVPAQEQAILDMARSDYLIQLLGSRDARRIQRFSADHASLNILVFETRLDGKPWHVAVTGPYPGRDAARAAIAQLPAGLRQQGAWARSVDSVQQDIRRLRQR